MPHYLTLDATKIQSEFPKSVTYLKAWVKNKALASGEGINMLEYKMELEKAIDDEYINSVLQYNPRYLYDFFDDQKILVCVKPLESGDFTTQLLGDEVGYAAQTRHLAEVKGFEIAFIELENRI